MYLSGGAHFAPRVCEVGDICPSETDGHLEVADQNGLCNRSSWTEKLIITVPANAMDLPERVYECIKSWGGLVVRTRHQKPVVPDNVQIGNASAA